ncbi:MAG TPA: pyridoxal phosphate-dependent aminotransferase [Phycisphaerales bacterium]|nr:pyridoxal phosphate-dependent aminotransferase [Phycisphaerales bacterium]
MKSAGLSTRAQAVRPSATLAVAQKARTMRARGVDVLSFAAGEPDFVTPEPIREATIRALNEGLTHYAPTLGTPEARAAVAEKLTSENMIPGLGLEHVAIGVGGKHCLYLAMQALLDPGEEVLLPVPSWVSYAPQVQLAGGTVVPMPTTGETGFKVSPEQLRSAISPRSRIFLINSPSNPCGTMYSPEELRALAEVVAEAAASMAPRLVIVSDEIYEKILYGGRTHLSIGSINAVAQRTVTINGLSKAYAMTGWRVGYSACPGDWGRELIAAIGRLQSQMTSGIPTFIMPAIRVALESCDAEVQRMADAFARRAELIERRLRQIPGMRFPSPEGAFYVFPDVSDFFGKKDQSGHEIASAIDFADALLTEQAMAVVPGDDFGGCGENHIRISFACSEDQINAGMDRFAEFIGSLG